MNSNSSTEIGSLKQAIAALESQRALLGDAVVDTALGPMREKLAALELPAPELPASKHPAPERITFSEVVPTAVVPSRAELPSPPSGEQRKLVTILFADLVGFTAMSENLDPEELRDITNAYFSRWSNVIEKWGGSVEKFIGDAVMAVFGIKTAGEDDPENAIQAALAMSDSLKTLNAEFAISAAAPSLAPIQLRMRVGIHTGQAVVSWLGERKGQDFVVVGDTVNLASRLQSLAPVNGILITHDTYRHVRGLFDVQVVEPVTVKGKRDPVQVYVVLGVKPRTFRRKLEGVEGVDTTLFGREAELAGLQAAFRQVAEHKQRQVVYILGEAGIGKTRLLLEFDHWLETTSDYTFFHGRASPFYKNLPFGLLRDVFANRFGIQDSDSPEVVREKLVGGVAEAYAGSETPADQVSEKGDGELGISQAWLVEMKAHFIGRLVGFGFGESEFLNTVEPRQLQERGFIYLSDYFSAIAARDPVVIMLEDLHWADDSAIDLLDSLRESLAPLPLLVVFTARPILLERRPGLGEGQEGRMYLNLEPLSQIDSQRQVEAILQKVEDLPDELVQLIVRSAEGNPFYVEELIKMLVEDGIFIAGEQTWQVSTSRLASLKIPPTLTEVLQARFDSLSPPEKAILQKAAVVGRTFWDQALAFMREQNDAQSPSGVGDSALENDLLERLNRREIVYSQSETTFENTREYFFKHALLRDVTYESLLKNYRRIYHAYAARWLENVAGRSQRADEFAALIGEHYELAGESPQAFAWFQQAARQAAQRFANNEALSLYERALALLQPTDWPARVDIWLGQAVIYGLVGDRTNQTRLLTWLDEASLQISDPHQAADLQAKIALEWADYAMQTGDYERAIAAASRAAQQAHAAGDISLEANAQSRMAGAYRYLSDYAQARAHNERARSLGEQAGSATLQANALFGLGVVCEIQGEYQPARRYLEEALELYRRSHDQRGESRVLNSLGVVETNLANQDQAAAHLESALQLKRLMSDRYGEGVTLCNLGIAMERSFVFEKAIRFFQQSLALSQEIDDPEGEEAALIGIGNNQMSLGNYLEARPILEQALAFSQEIDDSQGEAAICTSLGEIAIALGEPEVGLQLCQRAIAITQEIGAPSEMGYAWFYLGMGYETLGSASEAAAAYQSCLDIRQELGQYNQAIDAYCGLARSSLLSGNQQGALAWIELAMVHPWQGWEYGMSEPALYFLTCYRSLRASDLPRSLAALAEGRDFLQRIAAQIQDEAPRMFYLENVSANRALLVEAQQIE